MCCGKKEKGEEYQLRNAAGKYWLLHMGQRGIPYERPIQLNSMGAEMWQELQTGKTTEQMVDSLGKKYNVDREELREDLMRFYRQLKNYGISIGE